MNIATSIVAAPTWDGLRRAYESAKLAEDQYDSAVWTPQFHRCEADGTPIEDVANAEMERLIDLRYGLEDALMALPAPDAASFAFKYLIAHGDGRETDRWAAMLEAEAKLFAAEAAR